MTPRAAGSSGSCLVEEFDGLFSGTRRGDGVAKIRDFRIFIPRTQAGDKVKVKIIRVDRYARYATAKKIE